MSSSNLPEAGAKLILELTDWEAQWASAEDTSTSAISGIQSEIDSLSSDIDIGVNVDDTSIPETIDTELNVTEDENTKGILDGINFLATVEKIKIAIDVIGTAINFVKDMGALVVNPFLDVEDAVAKINAQTGSGTGIADLGQFIRDIQAADLGDSVDQIGDVIIQAKQLDLPIKDATESALTFTHTWKDVDPKTVVGAWGTALQTGIVDNMQEASDLMTVFFQQGGNIGGDAIQVVQANAQSWADMGLNMADALSLMNSLQSGTGATATDAAKMMQTFDDQFTAAAADPGSQQAKLLKMLGIDNPKEAGEAIGADTFNAFADSFTAQSSETQDLISGLFFGKGGKKFTGAIGEMTTEGGPFADVVGAASAAATEIDNSLRGAIDDFVLEVNTKLTELLSSKAIDLPGKIKALKEAFQEAVDVLANGGTVGDALEVALNIPGLSLTLDTFIGNFERIIGNLEIIFLQIVASIQDILPGHSADAAATRKTIKNKATAQLAFDLQLANPEEIGAMVDQAMGRGLSIDDITATLQTAMNESIAKANFDQGAAVIQGAIAGAIADGATPEAANHLAFDFVDKLKGGFDNALAAGNMNLMQDMIGIKPNGAVPGLDTAVASMQKQLSDAFAPKAGSANAVNPFTSAFQGISTAFTDAFPGQGKGGATSNSLLGGLTTDMDNFVAKATDGGNNAGIAMDHVATTADTMATNVGTSLDTVNTHFDTTAAEAALMDQGITLSLTDNTVTASFQAVADSAASSFPSVIAWFQRTGQAAAVFDSVVSVHLRSVLKQLNDLNFLAMTTIGNVGQATALGGAGGGNVTNNTVTVNNNVNNGAAAAANGYALGKSLRGMG